MSRIKIQGNGLGNGVFTIAAPNGNTDRTLTLPDEAGAMMTSASDVAASQITSALNVTGSAPIYACRAWVNFDGTGTVSIRASGNVSSITDGGTGLYRVNFATAMPDTDYSAVVTGTCGQTSGGYVQLDTQGWGGTGTNNGTTGWFNIRAVDGGTVNYIDHAWVTAAVFR